MIKKTKIKKFKLNQEQSKALNFLEKTSNKFEVSVLQGTTGSGKTIVYFERIKKIIEKNKQALVLLPEIFLTNDFKSRFEEFFGFEPAIWHSKITQKQKRIIWKGIIKNKIKILVGARSALLLPFKKLGIIIVDEEHDSSYKQDEGVIYNARDMAITRANFEKIPVHLVTSVPSIETYNNICKKKYRHIKIFNRYEEYPLPDTRIVNLNINKIKNKFIADETLNFVQTYLNKGDQILFFINRRGFAPYLICKKCRSKLICSNCSFYLTFHKIKKRPFAITVPMRENKIKCEKRYLRIFDVWSWSRKNFEEVKEIFPTKNCIFSSDYLKTKERTKIFLKILLKTK